MKEVYLKSSLAIIKVIINKEEYDDIKNDMFLYSYIPSLTILESGKYDAVVEVIKDKDNHINFNYPNIVYHYIDFNSKDVITLIEYVFERAREEKGIICIHGAGCIYKGKLVIMWGGTTGMGKTTLALELSKNGEFYSDEKILIDLNRSMGVGHIKNQYISNDYWRKKYNTNDAYKSLSNNDKDDYEIGLLIHPIICDSKTYVLDKWGIDKFTWHLYEESSRKIRGTSRVFFNNTYPALSLDTFELSSKRLELIKEFTKSIIGIYYNGNIEGILKEIDKLI